MTKPIYLDHAATTPVDPEVISAMLPYFAEEYGNPSSVHMWGQRAQHAVKSGREKIAAVLNCSADEIIFTACGSESDNLAIRGAALTARESGRGSHIVVSAMEHPAVLNTARSLHQLLSLQKPHTTKEQSSTLMQYKLAANYHLT